MPRFAFISDIHGNLPAFHASLDLIDRLAPLTVICLGDVVGYGPDPGPCLDLIAERGIFTVQGNHDLAVLDDIEAGRFNATARVAIEYTRDCLEPKHHKQLREMPTIANLDQVTISHASPIDDGPTDYIHDQSIAALAYGGFENHCLFVGHTHIPIAFGTPEVGYLAVEPKDIRVAFLPAGLPLRLACGYRYILNPGSVGQPRDGNPDASFGILDTDDRTFTVHRIAYDIAETQRAINAAGLPDFLAHRLRIGA